MTFLCVIALLVGDCFGELFVFFKLIFFIFSPFKWYCTCESVDDDLVYITDLSVNNNTFFFTEFVSVYLKQKGLTIFISVHSFRVFALSHVGLSSCWHWINCSKAVNMNFQYCSYWTIVINGKYTQHEKIMCAKKREIWPSNRRMSGELVGKLFHTINLSQLHFLPINDLFSIKYRRWKIGPEKRTNIAYTDRIHGLLLTIFPV